MISKIKYYTAVILVFLFNIPVYAAPNGANVVHGNVNITQSGSSTVINQNTDKAIINWNSFDINKGESVLFNQNSSSSIVLNRVTNGLPTNIFGSISANGNVFILNQAGVLVGNGASINTNSFLAGAANINDNDFIAGKYNFYGAQGNVINNGSIKVHNGGYAVLMGKNVTNNGLISAKLGKIYLSSGEAFRMDMSGNDLIGVEVEKGITDAYISNAGHIQAEGGTIIMTAKNASDVIRQAVNNTGIIDASSISYEGGKVILGAENGQIINDGEINVSSKSDDSGSIEIKAEHIINNGLIYANGLNGGTINMLSSDFLKIGSSSIIQANSFSYGNGGNIKLISQKRAESYNGALIEAGSIYGSGGFIELSGYDSVYAFGNFNTKSMYGRYGQFLLDPSNMFIGNYSNLADDENYQVSDDGNTYIDITWLNTQLDNNNVSLQTLQGNGSGDITLNAGVTLTGTNGLTLDAANNISLLGNIDGLSALTLNAGGSITGNNNITVGDISANAGNNILLSQLNVTGISSYISSNGNVSLTGSNIGMIKEIEGNTVGIGVTGNGISMDTALGTNKAAIIGQEVALKADGAINVSVDTANLSAESVNGSLGITNLNGDTTVLIKYLGGAASTYTQTNGVIDLSYIPENAIGQDLTISSEYGTVMAVDRLDALKGYTGLKIDANTIHFIENNDNPLTLDSSFLGNKTAVKYVFETNGDINVSLDPDSSLLLNSGIELISNNGSITSSNDISAMYFSAKALNDINVTSFILGGISLESIAGNIDYTHKAGPISIRGLKALNGNINVSLIGLSGDIPSIPGITIPSDFDIGDLYISGLASNNSVNITTANADTISISGSGETALDLNITNNNANPYKLEISNNYDITLNTANTQYNTIKLDSSNGSINFPVTDNTVTATDKIFLSANHINGDSGDLVLSSTEVYINQKTGSNSFEVSADKADINGSNVSVFLTKDTILTDINKDSYSVNGGSINILSASNISMQNKISSSDLNIITGSFNFESGGKSNVIQGNNVSINADGDITGSGKIIADRVNLTGSTIASTSNLLVLADYGHFISTAVDKPANDILININSDNWFENLKSYKFETSGPGLSYLNGKLVDYQVYDMVKDMYRRNLQPIENTNIDKVTGDDLVKGGRLQDTSELVTVEDNKTPKVNTITKKNKSIELK